jgi:glyoxylase-like metal-dependent hydrolase (beta-lactamase superfamily II)
MAARCARRAPRGPARAVRLAGGGRGAYRPRLPRGEGRFHGPQGRGHPGHAVQQNCSLLWDEDTGKGVVVDPGGDVDRIMAAVAETGAAVERILLTHGHMDHAGGAAELRDALAEGRAEPPPIIGPDERDRFLLEGLAEQAARFGIEGARDVLPDRWLSEGDEVEIGGAPSPCCTAPATPRGTSCS